MRSKLTLCALAASLALGNASCDRTKHYRQVEVTGRVLEAQVEQYNKLDLLIEPVEGRILLVDNSAVGLPRRTLYHIGTTGNKWEKFMEGDTVSLSGNYSGKCKDKDIFSKAQGKRIVDITYVTSLEHKTFAGN